MAEEPEAPEAGEKPVPPVRGTDEILADPLVADGVAEVRESVLEAREFVGELTLIVEASRIREVCESFRRAGFDYLVDLTAVDYSTHPGQSGDLRFAVVYQLYSFARNGRVRLKLRVAEGEKVPSVTSVWKTANWMEREVWDMFGIEFDGHPNLERILMWEGFNGHPLRKDFPVRGIDTGARIYPEVFPAGAGPQPGSTGKNAADVNLYQGEWLTYGMHPVSQPAPEKPALPAPATEEPAPADAAAPVSEASPATSDAAAAGAATAVTGASSADAPWHDETLTLPERMEMAKGKGLKSELFAAMAQTDCGACGWDCEGYAAALETGETDDFTLCVPGEAETEDELKKLLAAAGKV